MEVKDKQRLSVMVERLKEAVPDIDKKIEPDAVSFGIYKRLRHIQIKGECCGVPMGLDELREAVELATRASVKNPVNYLCRILSKKCIQETLKTIKARLMKLGAQAVALVKSAVKYAGLKTQEEIKYVASKIYKGFSMNDVVILGEKASKKSNPAHYFIACLAGTHAKARL